MALTDNLSAYYKFDESSGNAADSVGSNTQTNNGTTTYSAGLINNGANFGTTNTTKYFNGATLSALQNISFSAWVKIGTEPASGEAQHLIETGSGSSSSDWIEWRLIYRNVAGTKKLTFVRSKPCVAGQSAEYTVTLGTTNWHHIVGTYDTATLRLYLDGTEVATLSASGAGTCAGTSNNASRIGNAWDTDYGTGVFITGMIDEFGLWSRALSSTEVTTLYNSGAGLQYPFAAAGGAVRDARFLTLLGVG